MSQQTKKIQRLVGLLVLMCLWAVTGSNIGIGVGGRVLAGETIILEGGNSVWRSFVEWGSPVIMTSKGQVRGLIPKTFFWLLAEAVEGTPQKPWQSVTADKNWAATDFDDGEWFQGHCPVGPALHVKNWKHPGFSMWDDGSPSRVTRTFTRGRFMVKNPAGAGGLKLRLEYCGGIIVYVNGQELARKDVLKKSPGHGIRGTPYPAEVYVAADGSLIKGAVNRKSTPADLANYQRRVRRFSVDIPRAKLRSGLNVLGIETLRSPILDVYREKIKDYKGKKYRPWPWTWPHCRLLNVRMIAERAGSVIPNVGRPVGVQLWQVHPWSTITGFDYGCSLAPIKPIKLVGFRGGAFGSKLVLGSSSPIVGIKVKASSLQGSGGSIAANLVVVRYARSEGNRFSGLENEAPATVPVTHFKRKRKDPGTRAAVQPLWIRVNVPGNTKAGKYSGSLTVQASGLKKRNIPIEITVHDWLYPETAKLATHNNLWQSHEVSALRYKVPLWSDQHFALIGKSLALSKQLANRFCHLPLTVGSFQCGNRETMVRWIRKSGSGKSASYDYDFKVFDRYLDVYAKSLGKPRVLMVDVCVPIHSRQRPKDGSNPIKVSRLDPASGKVEPMSQPAYGSPEGLAFWKPVLSQVRKRLEKRGWWDVTMLGTASDSGPTRGETTTFKAIWPNRKWVCSGHPFRKTVGGKIASIGSLAWVWGCGKLWDPDDRKHSYPRPWKDGFITVAFPRLGCSSCTLRHMFPLRDYRIGAEKNLQCGQDGIGRVGLDFWKYTDKRGRLRQLHTQGGQFSFDGSFPRLVEAGSKGPILTTRGEMYREGIQVREAITFLLKRLDAGKLSAALAGKVRALVLKRAANMRKSYGFRNWQNDEGLLFGLCAEVARQGK